MQSITEIRKNFDQYLPDCKDYIKTVEEFMQAYPMIDIRSFNNSFWNDTIMNIIGTNFKSAVLSEILFKKDEIYNPGTISYIEKYKINGVRFCKVMSFEHNNEENCLVITFFKVSRKGHYYDIFRQLTSTEIRGLVNDRIFEACENYEFRVNRDIIFDIQKPISEWNIIPEIKYLYSCKQKEKQNDLINFIECLISSKQEIKDIYFRNHFGNLFMKIYNLLKVYKYPTEQILINILNM